MYVKRIVGYKVEGEAWVRASKDWLAPAQKALLEEFVAQAVRHCDGVWTSGRKPGCDSIELSIVPVYEDEEAE